MDKKLKNLHNQEEVLKLNLANAHYMIKQDINMIGTQNGPSNHQHRLEQIHEILIYYRHHLVPILQLAV